MDKVDIRNGIPPHTIIVDKFSDGVMITDTEDRFVSFTWDEVYALVEHLKQELSDRALKKG